MARLAGFCLSVFVLVALLRALPGLGGWFGGFWSFWLVAIALGYALTRAGVRLNARRRLGGQMRALRDVDSAHNQGKLGALLLAHGSVGRALPHLERAAAGEPDVPEWSYRLGQALTARGRAREAVAALERAAALDEEHAYGGVQLALAAAREADGDQAGALEAVAIFERNHGPSPESAYRRGRALRALGRRDEARAAFDEVGDLARRAAAFQRSRTRPWALRAWLARLV
ncbi:MAG TPA: tetratricopeptide repeat protein [Planctomycetota bacterium]|nr:tetratricopeptide repeat protein [Planctomycetota bacterium]